MRSGIFTYESGIRIVAKNLKLKAARAALDMTQKDLAEAIGVSRQTMNAIEKGDYYPSVKLCIEICKVLGKTAIIKKRKCIQTWYVLPHRLIIN